MHHWLQRGLRLGVLAHSCLGWYMVVGLLEISYRLAHLRQLPLKLHLVVLETDLVLDVVSWVLLPLLTFLLSCLNRFTERLPCLWLFRRVRVCAIVLTF